MSIANFLVYPIEPGKPDFLERTFLSLKRGVIYCNVCGSIVKMKITDTNVRENCFCEKCFSKNRHRQLAMLINHELSQHLIKRVRSLRHIPVLKDFVIYNTEAEGPLHNYLKRHENYVCSEFFGTQYRSGDKVNGVMHQDLMNPSLADESVDMIISTEVFEHIPDPYLAHSQVYRILKKGGFHIFTVPFYQNEFLDENKAFIKDGEINYTMKPEYHDDPVRPSEGVLVFNIFALEMLTKLRKIGFNTNMYRFRKPQYGILGSNGIVFCAKKI